MTIHPLSPVSIAVATLGSASFGPAQAWRGARKKAGNENNCTNITTARVRDRISPDCFCTNCIFLTQSASSGILVIVRSLRSRVELYFPPVTITTTTITILASLSAIVNSFLKCQTIIILKFFFNLAFHICLIFNYF